MFRHLVETLADPRSAIFFLHNPTSQMKMIAFILPVNEHVTAVKPARNRKNIIKTKICQRATSEYQELHANHSGRDYDSGEENACRDGRERWPKTKSQQEGNSTARPGPGHGQRYGHEDGQGCQPKILMLLNVLSAGTGKKPGKEPVTPAKTPQVI